MGACKKGHSSEAVALEGVEPVYACWYATSEMPM